MFIATWLILFLSIAARVVRKPVLVIVDAVSVAVAIILVGDAIAVTVTVLLASIIITLIVLLTLIMIWNVINCTTGKQGAQCDQ